MTAGSYVIDDGWLAPSVGAACVAGESSWVFSGMVWVFRQGLVVAGSSVCCSWVVFQQDLVVTGTFWLSSA